MIAIFELGTIWFWVLICMISIVLMAVQENAKSPGSWSTAWVIGAFITLYYLGAGISIKALGIHILHNPIETVVYFLMYTLVGTVWSFWKWKEIVDRQAGKYAKALVKTTKDTYFRPNIKDYKPLAKDYTGELFNWIFYWPFSMTWFVIHEPIERLFRFIMEKTKKIYEGIANKAFDKVQIPEKPNENIYNENI